MHIAILGTRGIPNNYGGNEQCAQKISEYFVKKGNSVTVYCPDDHPYAETVWNGIALRRVFAHEKHVGIWGTFTYDYLCLRDAAARDYDIILELGYVPAACFYDRIARRRPIVTNMDGLEWARGKWNRALRRFAKYCERTAAMRSTALIADNEGIRQYLMRTYSKQRTLIPYGAELLEAPQEKHLAAFTLAPRGYYLLIARLEPENNIECVLDGYLASGAREPFVIIGSPKTPYGRNVLRRKYARHDKIIFAGAIYDYAVLGSLRHFAKIYFHGHSVGGTNPSLLEAMAAGAHIASFEVEFNRYVLREQAMYFSNSDDVRDLINNYNGRDRARHTETNRNKIKDIYTWENVSQKYLEVFSGVVRDYR